MPDFCVRKKSESGNSDLKELQKCIFLFYPFKCKKIYLMVSVNFLLNICQIKIIGPIFICLKIKNINLITATLLHFLFQLDCLNIFLWLCKTWTFLFESRTSFLITRSSSYKKKEQLATCMSQNLNRAI